VTDPVLHVLAGPNGAGKTTLYERVIAPSTRLPFVNADVIAAREWPGAEAAHAYDAAKLAAAERTTLIEQRRSFVTETVFSHASKVELLAVARDRGYLITLHILLIPAELAVLRVGDRVGRGGHVVPERKIVERWERLWSHVVTAAPVANEVFVYDNSSASRPYRVVAHLRDGKAVRQPDWPDWTPEALRALPGFPT
jgi:predicted ABC-type ATPase